MDKTGLPMLWLVDDLKARFEVSLTVARDHYERKYGHKVVECQLHPQAFEQVKAQFPPKENKEVTVLGIRIVASQYVLPRHYLIIANGAKEWKAEMSSTP